MKFKSKLHPHSLKVLLFFIIAFSINGHSQEEAWVYFTDKPNSDIALSNPSTILTQKALTRKATHNVAIDVRDVPVDEGYISQIKNQTGVTVMAKSKWFNCVHVRGSVSDIENVLNLPIVSEVIFADDNLNSFTFRKTKTVAAANPINKFEHEKRLVDFDYGSAANQIEMLNGDELHRQDFTGTNMTIAVMDSGFPNVDTNPAFARMRNNGNFKGGYDFVDRNPDIFAYTGNSHGAWVLSDMAGFLQNQFVGTAPDASYYLFRTEKAENETPLEESLWVEALERADSLGVDVVNTSLGYSTYDNPNYSYGPEDLDGNTAFNSRGASIAFEKGMLLVNSAGNSGSNGLGTPADSPGVLSIGAVRADGTYASFSSQGTSVQPTQKPDVVAQGQGSAVVSTNGSLSTLNGTSFSSPILAGAIACLWQALPTLNNGEIMQLVRESASQYDNPDFFLGYGIPDFKSILDQTLAVDDVENSNGQIVVFPNPASNEVKVLMPETNQSVDLEIFNILGKKVAQRSMSSMKNSMNTSSLSSGVYLMHFTVQDKSLKTIKLIIE